MADRYPTWLAPLSWLIFPFHQNFCAGDESKPRVTFTTSTTHIYDTAQRAKLRLRNREFAPYPSTLLHIFPNWLDTTSLQDHLANHHHSLHFNQPWPISKMQLFPSRTNNCKLEFSISFSRQATTGSSRRCVDAIPSTPNPPHHQTCDILQHPRLHLSCPISIGLMLIAFCLYRGPTKPPRHSTGASPRSSSSLLVNLTYSHDPLLILT